MIAPPPPSPRLVLVTKQEMIEVQKAEAQGAQDVHALEVQRFETRLLVRRVTPRTIIVINIMAHVHEQSFGCARRRTR